MAALNVCIGCGKTISGNKLTCLDCRSQHTSNDRTESAVSRIEQLWLNYRWAVLPKDASDIELTECKRAFFAGGHAFFTAVMGFLTSGSEVQEQDLINLGLMEAELRRFNDKVKRGLA